MAINRQEEKYEIMWDIFRNSKYAPITILRTRLDLAIRGLFTAPDEVIDAIK